jgi:hypothetical protein
LWRQNRDGGGSGLTGGHPAADRSGGYRLLRDGFQAIAVRGAGTILLWNFLRGMRKR